MMIWFVVHFSKSFDEVFQSMFNLCIQLEIRFSKIVSKHFQKYQNLEKSPKRVPSIAHVFIIFTL